MPATSGTCHSLRMNWEIAIVYLLLVGAMVSFIMERVSADQTAVTVFAALLVLSLLPFAHSLPTTTELLTVFANAAPITVGAMFVLSAAMEKCGLIEILAVRLSRLTKLGVAGFTTVMILGVAFVSAFINNTPVVVVFLPVILSLARTLQVPASKLLIPLSYAAIFGGTCTLVGTSTNILASEIMVRSGYPPLRMFELAAVGLPLLVIGTAYLVLLGPRLLPNRETLTALLSEDERREYLAEAFIRAGSSLDGKSLAESGLLANRGLRVLEIIRNNIALRGHNRETVLTAGDRLVLSCRPTGLAHARSVEGLDLATELAAGLETISAHEGALVEGVIGPKSPLGGRTIRELNFRQRYRMILLAIHRRGVNLRDQIDTVPLEFGDTLLMMGTSAAIEELRRSDDILLLDRPSTPSVTARSKQPIVLGVIGSIVALASLNLVSIAPATLIGVTLLFATGCLKPKEGYAAVEWSILMLIYGMLGLGLAMEKTGAARAIAEVLVAGANLLGNDLTPHTRAVILLAGLFLITTTFTEIMSNNACVAVMTPIALSMGVQLGVDPRAYVVAVCIASSASFATPIGYQTNTYVYGVGGYKFTDFLKIGLPLNLLYLVGSVLIIPHFWPI